MNYIELIAIVLGITTTVGIALAVYLTKVCTRETDDEEYESENYADNYRGRYQGDDKEILEKLNKEYKK